MIHECVPWLAALVVAAGLAGAIAVVAAANSTANGLPAYTNGYTGWKKLNKKPITGGSSAHFGVKNVYASKPRAASRKFPNGTVIVKTIADTGRQGAARPGGGDAQGERQVAVGRVLALGQALLGVCLGSGVHLLPHGREVARLGLHEGVDAQSQRP